MFSKLIRGMGLVFSANVQHIFLGKFPYLILDQLTKFQYQIYFTSQNIPVQIHDDVMDFRVYCESLIIMREERNIKIEYLENEKSFFGKIKSFFRNFLSVLLMKYVKIGHNV